MLWMASGTLGIEIFIRSSLFSSSAVNAQLATVLISRTDIKPAQTLKLITVLEEILTKRNEFLRTHQNQVPEFSFIE